MQNITEVPSPAWVSLLWLQYSKLPEPLKEGFINLAHCIAEEVKNTGVPVFYTCPWGEETYPAERPDTQ